MKILVGSDHAGVFLKGLIVSLLEATEREVEDVGAHSESSVDYPDYGGIVARAVSEGKCDKGILICGSGIGMSIVANRFPGVRAALCHDLQTVELSRRHNDSNILVLGEKLIDSALAILMVSKWLDVPFDGGRHAARLEKLEKIGNRCCKNG